MHQYGSFPQKMGTPSYHPFLCGIFHEINHLASLGYPHDELETPMTEQCSKLLMVDYTTHDIGDYNNPIAESLSTNQDSME